MAQMGLSDYNRLLEEHNNFQECQLLDYWSENLCRDFVMLVDNIWQGPGKMVSELDEVHPFLLRFNSCQRIYINNAFSDYILQHPEEVQWG
ncbi:MAG: hypothetical protein KY468_17015, partial [Armatimonadetes bacterium]|nr:hypothetical protein [Armatimonadota bacterium]